MTRTTTTWHILFLLCFFPLIGIKSLYAQKKKLTETAIFRKFLSSESDSSRSANFMVFPVLGYAQETAWEYGLNGSYNFYLDKTDTLIRSSSINALASLTTKHQSNLKIQADVWSLNNTYHYTGEIRYRHFPFHFYGTGINTREINQDILIQNLFRLDAEVEKKIHDRLYTGVNFRFEDFQYEDKESGGIFESGDFYGATGGRYLSLGISQAYDSRNSNTYTTRGIFAKIKLTYAPDFWGHDHFSGALAETDLRIFAPLSPAFTWAINGVYETIISARVPFYLLPQLGSDEIMRGYYRGRYRDKNMAALQTALRYRIHPRIGAELFTSAGSVFPNLKAWKSIKISYGGGISYFFDIEHQSSVRIDYGIGAKKPGEKRQSGFYISLGQAF